MSKTYTVKDKNGNTYTGATELEARQNAANAALDVSNQNAALNTYNAYRATTGRDAYAGTEEQAQKKLAKLDKKGKGQTGDYSAVASDGTTITGISQAALDANLQAYEGGLGLQSTASVDPYQDFTVSSATQNMLTSLQSQLETLKKGKTSYTEQLLDAMNAYRNREGFSYDPTNDPLFQQALSGAMVNGRQAMQDTMGQAAGLTGGYGSTYSQSVGNQAYNDMVQGAYDNVADYYNMALNAYNTEGQQLLDSYNMLAEQDAQEYGRQLDAYNAQANMYSTAYNNELNAYNAARDNYYQAEGLDYNYAGLAQDDAQYYAGLAYDAEESEKNRTWQTGERIGEQEWKSGENATDREYESTENQKQRDFQAGENALDRAQDQSQFEASMAEKIREFDTGTELDYQKLAEDIRQFDESNTLDWAKFKESMRQFDEENRIDWAKLEETIRSNMTAEELDRMGLEESARHNAVIEDQNQQGINLDAATYDAKYGEGALEEEEILKGIPDITNDMVTGARDAYSQGGEEGLDAYLAMYYGRYSDEAIDDLESKAVNYVKPYSATGYTDYDNMGYYMAKDKKIGSDLIADRSGKTQSIKDWVKEYENYLLGQGKKADEIKGLVNAYEKKLKEIK